MLILTKIASLAAEYSKMRRRYKTERSVRALPLEIQKDIGWLDLQSSNSTHSTPEICK
ncbi:hypothetical protein C7441_11748 [Pseudaminobacter salicylatoxidans]|uniref:Uncharacterized protein n=1 Tax=Pseudaminobacter salicylatoxidans TaxID=93369 RepID=A0A316BUK4_PSESE|nr:hypothetical protein [Pseudaminobacter salicylatoxidans]PWJ77637.1 hypothetical protein C7441_11748 [Pseudaminobacter salicylatoxidans]